MALKNIPEISEFWNRMFSDKGMQLQSPAAKFKDLESSGQVFDVGKVVLSYQKSWIGTSPNNVTPENLIPLLRFLDEFTSELEAQDFEARHLAGTGDVRISCDELSEVRPGLGQPCIDLRRWRVRLDEYIRLVSLVPEEEMLDRQTTLWGVTAPLFTGWYGGCEEQECGPGSHLVELPEGGVFDGFNTDLQHPPDIATPYMLANSYGIEKAWEAERRERFFKDIMPELDDVAVSNIKQILAYSAVGATALYLLFRK